MIFSPSKYYNKNKSCRDEMSVARGASPGHKIGHKYQPCRGEMFYSAPTGLFFFFKLKPGAGTPGYRYFAPLGHFGFCLSFLKRMRKIKNKILENDSINEEPFKSLYSDAEELAQMLYKIIQNSKP